MNIWPKNWIDAKENVIKKTYSENTKINKENNKLKKTAENGFHFPEPNELAKFYKNSKFYW